MSDGRPHGREFLVRSYAIPVLLRLSTEGACTENRLREDVPYKSLLTTLAWLSEAGWVEQVHTELSVRLAEPTRVSRIVRWGLTEEGRTLASMLDAVGKMMDGLDGNHSD